MSPTNQQRLLQRQLLYVDVVFLQKSREDRVLQTEAAQVYPEGSELKQMTLLHWVVHVFKEAGRVNGSQRSNSGELFLLQGQKEQRQGASPRISRL